MTIELGESHPRSTMLIAREALTADGAIRFLDALETIDHHTVARLAATPERGETTTSP